jgi:hypothetical protein
MVALLIRSSLSKGILLIITIHNALIKERSCSDDNIILQ